MKLMVVEKAPVVRFAVVTLVVVMEVVKKQEV